MSTIRPSTARRTVKAFQGLVKTNFVTLKSKISSFVVSLVLLVVAYIFLAQLVFEPHQRAHFTFLEEKISMAPRRELMTFVLLLFVMLFL